MKRYEWESLLKSFFIFWVLLEILLALNSWSEYRIKRVELDKQLRVEMKLCAFTLECQGFMTDFVEKSKESEENILYKKENLYVLYRVPTVQKYLMKVIYPHASYLKRQEKLKEEVFQRFLLFSLFASLVSLLFSYYALTPLRQGLRLNEEFVRDILHDFNTPISSMRINLKLFKREIGENPKIARLENNIETILSLQNNLQVFLKGIPTQTEPFSLDVLVQKRVNYFRVLYSDIRYEVDIPSTTLHTNVDAFTRILDNLLSNAGKYNSANGEVKVTLESKTLLIADTGKGMKHPSRAFERYYKEQERGIGIGLHVVKKLANELQIDIRVRSKERQGTTMYLELHKVWA